MVIEKIADEFIIRIPATGDISDIQDFLNYLRFRELTSKFTASTADVDSIVSSVKQNWRERRTPNS